MSKLTLVTAPDQEPLTVAEVKEHLNIHQDNTRDDALINMWIPAARQWVERYLNKYLVEQTWRYQFDCFPGLKYVNDFLPYVSSQYKYYFELPRNPVMSISSITYIDINLSPNLNTLSTSIYLLDADETERRARVYLAYDQQWPSGTRDHVNDITVNFTVGHSYSTATSPYDKAENVPMPIKQAMLLIIGDFNLNRERKMDIQVYENDTAEMLLEPYRLLKI